MFATGVYCVPGTRRWLRLPDSQTGVVGHRLVCEPLPLTPPAPTNVRCAISSHSADDAEHGPELPPPPESPAPVPSSSSSGRVHAPFKLSEPIFITHRTVARPYSCRRSLG